MLTDQREGRVVEIDEATVSRCAFEPGGAPVPLLPFATAGIDKEGSELMNLEYEFTYSATLKEPLNVGPGPFGNRMVFEVTGGRCDGPRLKGEVLTGGADWMLIGSSGPMWR